VLERVGRRDRVEHAHAGHEAELKADDEQQPVLPQEAFTNLQTLHTRYPGIYTSEGGFYDAVNPVTGSIGLG
jgi:hypothetical protein